jgi:DNA-binding Lrp family transcriptional regulator
VLRRREKDVFVHLLANARMPDKHIAKILGITQPTVTRIRQKLEKNGYINGYRPVVDFQKMGIGIIVITLFRISDFSKTEEIKRKVVPELRKTPEIVLVAEGEGMGKTSVIISVHKDFREFEELAIDIRQKYGKYMDDIEQFIFSTNRIYKNLSVEEAIINFLKRGMI